MPEDYKKTKDEFKTHRSEGKDTVYKNGSCLLFQNVSTRVHWHAEEGKSNEILSLNLATVITAAAYKLHSWADMNLQFTHWLTQFFKKNYVKSCAHIP